MLRPERSDAWPVPASMAKWERNWMQKWFYINNPYPAEDDDKANWLRFWRLAVSIVAKPNVEIDGTLESRLILLRKVARRLSTRELCEEFCLLRISLLADDWGISVSEDEEVLGLPHLVLPTETEREFRFRFLTSIFFTEIRFGLIHRFHICRHRLPATPKLQREEVLRHRRLERPSPGAIGVGWFLHQPVSGKERLQWSK